MKARIMINWMLLFVLAMAVNTVQAQKNDCGNFDKKKHKGSTSIYKGIPQGENAGDVAKLQAAGHKIEQSRRKDAAVQPQQGKLPAADRKPVKVEPPADPKAAAHNWKRSAKKECKNQPGGKN
ncbi:MAG: hypothetical protein KDC32_11280 [Saprospiraceae bacterium]|nr:hypothetical protein [Saprospiraceae bacterium]MCB0681482.1 hypothetical protein [Saprospiraceae bacterium]